MLQGMLNLKEALETMEEHCAAKPQPNPESEYRNPKQTRMRKARNPKPLAVQVWRI